MTSPVKLFCIPFSGGNAWSYSSFRKYLSDNIQLCPLELPGRGMRISEPLLSDIDAMSDDLFRQIEHQTSGRYAIFGHSLGALLAFTLCRKITQTGTKLPVALFLSGQTAPSLIKPDERHLLPDEQFVNMLREMDGTPEELLSEKSFLEFYLPIVKSDFQAIGKYQYKPKDAPLQIPIVLLLGSAEKISDEDAACWQMETDREVSVFRFDGGHFFINGKAREVCRLLSEKCNQFQ